MIINQVIFKGKWLEIKGNVNSIAGIVMQKYGEEKEKFMNKISQIVESLRADKAVGIKNVKPTIKS